jgi:hypothetical protein
MRIRRGVSLVELLLAMSACTFILSLSVALIHRVMHAQSSARRFDDVERSAARLASSLREDVHRAASATMPDAALGEGAFLRLQVSGQTIEYRHADGTVFRLALDGDKTASRDQFPFPAGIQLTVRQETPRLISIAISSETKDVQVNDSQSASPAFTVPVSIQIQAVLERDRLFAGRGQETP